MSPLYTKIIRDFVTIWTTVDPISCVALFAGLTASFTPSERRRVAFRASIYATIILIVAVVAGQIILDAIGVHLHSLKVAGGIILFLFGIQMLFGKFDSNSPAPETGRDLAVFPLAVPAIAGPGAMMAVILLTDNDVYTIPQQMETGVVLPRRAIYQFRPTYSFYRNPTRDRATRSGGAGARDGDYPGLVSSRNRADRSSSWRLGTGAALGKRNGSVFNEER
jgi:multiple antibiotic resistance protein